MNTQTYPGQGLSLSQLVFALNEELKRTAFCPSFSLQAVSLLDGDTTTALAIIREWKNSFVRINRVPLDVLSLIPTFLSSQNDRLRASFVCRHWRRTFLQRADLWSQLFLSKGEAYVKTLLGRARGTPLDITLTFADPVSRVTLLSPHTKQIRDLYLTLHKWTDIQTFSITCPGPLPLLHTLQIGFYAITFLGLSNINWTPPLLPLFRNAVNLKEFRFHSNTAWSPSLSQFIFPNLVTFDFIVDQTDIFHAFRLLDFLEASPMLRTTHMRITSDVTLEGVPRERIVLLPKVEIFELTMATDGGPGYEIVTRISCPSAKRTTIGREIFDHRIIPEEIFPTSVSWDAIAHQYTPGPFEEVTLEMKLTSTVLCNLTFRTPSGAYINLCFRAFPGEDTDDDDEDDDDEDPLAAEVYHQVFTQATRTIRNCPQLAKLKRLHIHHDFPSIPPVSFPRIANEAGRLFKVLGPLDELTIDRCDLRQYFHSFLGVTAGYVKEPVVFPPIKKLTILHPSFSSGGQFAKALVGLTKSHHERGIPFERVIIRTDHMLKEMEGELGRWVRNVEYRFEEFSVELSETEED